ncbi:MAG TPA: COX15/CtaA family protein [Planctomycetota bacterium]
MSATLALESVERTSGLWPRRWALGAALAAVPLVLFGGSVTTLGAGMAVEGWLIAEGHFLLFFPVEKWFRDTATFVEHTHRLFGVLVGLCALACVAATWLNEAGARARRSALVALAAVCLQGTLGGLRVLADDSQLAFLHGALAQLVFALLAANVLLVSGEWRVERARVGAPAERTALARVARVAWLVTLAQVALGAWYRHGLRPVPVASEGLRFLLHGLGALLVLASAAAVMRRAAPLRTAGPLPASLVLALRALPVVLLVQLVLGGLAWAGFRPGAIGPAEWGLSILHVLGGAVLLSALTLVVLWSARLARPEAAR